jgi:hypothetical protein
LLLALFLPKRSLAFRGPWEIEAVLSDFSRLKMQTMLNSTAELDAQSVQALFHADLMADQSAHAAISSISTTPITHDEPTIEDFEDATNDKSHSMALPSSDPSTSADGSH